MDNPKVCFLVINLANAHCIVRKRQISFHSLPFQDKLLFFVMTFLKLSSFCLQCNSQGSYFIQLGIPFSVLETTLLDFKTNDFTSLIFFFNFTWIQIRFHLLSKQGDIRFKPPPLSSTVYPQTTSLLFSGSYLPLKGLSTTTYTLTN